MILVEYDGEFVSTQCHEGSIDLVRTPRKKNCIDSTCAMLLFRIVCNITLSASMYYLIIALVRLYTLLLLLLLLHSSVYVAAMCVCVCAARTRHIVDTIECTPWLNGHTMYARWNRKRRQRQWKRDWTKMNEQHVCVHTHKSRIQARGPLGTQTHTRTRTPREPMSVVSMSVCTLNILLQLLCERILSTILYFI